MSIRHITHILNWMVEMENVERTNNKHQQINKCENLMKYHIHVENTF